MFECTTDRGGTFQQQLQMGHTALPKTAVAADHDPPTHCSHDHSGPGGNWYVWGHSSVLSRPGASILPNPCTCYAIFSPYYNDSDTDSLPAAPKPLNGSRNYTEELVLLTAPVGSLRLTEANRSDWVTSTLPIGDEVSQRGGGGWFHQKQSCNSGFHAFGRHPCRLRVW